MARQNLVRPGGPLPARVYWRRRVVVLGGALVLVLLIGRMLTGSSDGKSDGQDVAKQTSAEQKTSEPVAESATSPTTTPPVTPTKTKEPLPEPEGDCTADDIVVSTDVSQVTGGDEITLPLILTTKSSPACVWDVSADTLTLTITSGGSQNKDRIWTSQQCGKAIDGREVVVRSETETEVEVVWSGRRSDDDCSRSTDYALPGWYHLEAAAVGGEPTDSSFELVAPTTPTITKGADGDEDKGDKSDKSDRDKPRDNLPEDGESSPSGAVEPDGR